MNLNRNMVTRDGQKSYEITFKINISATDKMNEVNPLIYCL